MTTSRFLTAFLGGAAAGVTLALLYAPQTGRETRRKIMRRVDDGADYVDRLVDEGKKSWYKAQGQMDENAGIAADQIDDFIRHIAQKGKKMWRKGKNEWNQAKDDMANAVEDTRNYGDQAYNSMGANF